MTEQSIEDLRLEADQRREAIGRDVELVTDRVAPGRIADRQKAKFRQGVGGVRDSVFGTSDRNRPSGSDDASLRDKAGGKLSDLNEQTPDSVGEFTEGNPLVAGLIGLGVGLLAASLIPTTREEQDLADRAQDSIDSAAQQLARSGQQTAESVKPAAEDAAQEVKSSAQDSADSVKSDAQGAAKDVKDSAQSKAQDVKSDS